MNRAAAWTTVTLLALISAISGSARPPVPAAVPGARPPRIDPEKVAVVVIDAQPAFWKIMHGEREPVEARMEQLLLMSDLHQLPLIATFEHDPKWNGWLPERLERVFPKHGKRIIKRSFDCCREPDVRKALTELRKTHSQVVVAGAETDVCVLQSCLGLLEMGFQVFLLEDTLFTNEPNTAPAIARLRQAGCVPSTYKTFYFEVTKAVGNRHYTREQEERWKEYRKKMVSPYRLPKSGD